MKVRDRRCLDCKHAWTSHVRFAPATANLSGEISEFCPKCVSRNVVSDPMRDDGKPWIELPRTAEALRAYDNGAFTLSKTHRVWKAFFEDTKTINSESACDATPLSYIRELVATWEAQEK